MIDEEPATSLFGMAKAGIDVYKNYPKK